jgi:hypothetical protein
MVLQLMLLHGANLHTDCYWGGSVFHAVLDHSIESSGDHGPLDRKAKFLALIEHGFDPSILAANGKDAIQFAIFAFDNGKAGSSVHEIDSIIGYLRFYDIYGRWPEDETETLDLCQSIQWPTEADRGQRDSLQTEEPAQESAQESAQRSVQESADLYGDDASVELPTASESTVRRRRPEQTDNADHEGRTSSEPAEPASEQPQGEDFKKNVSKMADAVEDMLKLTTAEATVTMNKWKTTFASNWKKLTD